MNICWTPLSLKLSEWGPCASRNLSTRPNLFYLLDYDTTDMNFAGIKEK